MTKRWTLRAGLLAVVLALAGVLPDPALRAQPPAGANVTVNPVLYKDLAFRNLTVFSRGGRVTAVAGVPYRQTEIYMLALPYALIAVAVLAVEVAILAAVAR